MAVKINDVRIDELAQTVMWLLRDADRQRSAPQLVDEVDVDDTGAIRYRLNNLQEAGVADHVDSIKKQPGAQRPTKYYVINEKGLEWLYEHQEDVEDAVGRKRYIDSLDRVREMVMDTKQEIREFEENIDDIETGLQERFDDEMDAFKANVDRVERNLNKDVTELEDQISDLETELNRIDELESRVDELEKAQDGVNIKELAKRQNELVRRVNGHYDILKRLWRRMRYNARELLNLNIAKVTYGEVDPTEAGETKPPMFGEIDPTETDGNKSHRRDK